MGLFRRLTNQTSFETSLNELVARFLLQLYLEIVNHDHYICKTVSLLYLCSELSVKYTITQGWWCIVGNDVLLGGFSQWHPSDRAGEFFDEKPKPKWLCLLSSLIFCTYVWFFYAIFLFPEGGLICPNPVYLVSFVLPVILLCIQHTLFALLCTYLFSALHFCVNWIPFPCHCTPLYLSLWWSCCSYI